MVKSLKKIEKARSFYGFYEALKSFGNSNASLNEEDSQVK